MKTFLTLSIAFSLLLNVFAQSDSSGLPVTWDQNTGYDAGKLVISNGSTYLALQTVPNGTPLTSTSFWVSLDSQVPATTTVPELPKDANGNVVTPDVTQVASLTTPTNNTDTNDTTTPSDDPDLPNAGSTDVVLGGISTTGFISGNGGRLSAGFAISGGEMTVLTTGKGAKEYLSTGVLQDTLNDPKMEIKGLSGGGWVSQHSDLNWKTGSYFSQLNTTGFFAQYEDDDTGIYEALPANNYLAEITSTDGDSGGTLVEVYETYGYWNSNYTGSKLEGISTNGYVQAGTEPGQRMTAGVALRNFGTDANATKRLIVMAKWSTYVPSNDTDPNNDFDILDDPKIEVTDVNKNILAQNDNWGTLPASVKTAVTTTGLMNGFRDDKDAAVIVNLPGSGVYFVNVYSADSDSGGALVEVYDLDALEAKYGWNLGN
jgi:hypothetical protein